MTRTPRPGARSVGHRMRYAIVIENAGVNFSAYVPDLPGCVATGDTLSDTETAIRDAIELHLDGMREDGAPIPPPTSRVDYVEIAARLSLERTRGAALLEVEEDR